MSYHFANTTHPADDANDRSVYVMDVLYVTIA